MANGTLRLTNWNYLGGRIVGLLIALGFSVACGYCVATGKVGQVDSFGKHTTTSFDYVFAVILMVGFFFGALSYGYHVFRRYALWFEFGDRFRFRMLTGGGTRKWSDVKNVKLLWEHDEDERRSYLQVEVVVKGEKKMWVSVNEKQAVRVEQFARSRFPVLGVQFMDKT